MTFSLGAGFNVPFISGGNEYQVLHLECYRSSGGVLLSAINKVSLFLQKSRIPSNPNLSGQRCWEH